MRSFFASMFPDGIRRIAIVGFPLWNEQLSLKRPAFPTFAPRSQSRFSRKSFHAFGGRWFLKKAWKSLSASTGASRFLTIPAILAVGFRPAERKRSDALRSSIAAQRDAMSNPRVDCADAMLSVIIHLPLR